MALLRRLAIRAPSAAGGVMPAGLKSRELGMSLELADSRAYAQGDDPRHLDWGQLAKFDQLVVRLFYAQRALRVALALDCSASMNFGTPDKFDYARSLAACIGIVALNGRHEFDLFPSHHLVERSFRRRIAGNGDAAMADVMSQLKALEPDGATDFPAQWRQTAPRRRDVLFLISDCLPPEDLSSAFNAVVKNGERLVLIHTLSPEELAPDWSGTQVLRDPESGRVQRIAASPQGRIAYKHGVDQWRRQLAQSAQRSGGHYIDISTSDAIESVLTRIFTGVLNA